MVARKLNEINRHTRVNSAIDMFIILYLEVFNETPLFSKILSDEARYLIMLKLTSLIWGRNSYPTVSQVQEFAIKYSLASRTRVNTIINICSLLGIINRKIDIKDKRSRIILPTEKFVRLVRNSFKYYREPISIIYPEHFKFIHENDLCFIGEMAKFGIEFYINDCRLVDDVEGAHLFSRRDGGFELLLKVLKKTDFPYSDEPQIISYPFSRAALDLLLSRSHIQKIFKCTEEAGLLINLEAGGKKYWFCRE